MKRHAKKYTIVFFLWILFSVCCLAAPLAAMFFHWYKRGSYMRRFVRTADRLIAAMLGFSGRHTLSAELASSDRYRWLHDILNAAEPNHCENEMYAEGTYCRISDHKEFGDK